MTAATQNVSVRPSRVCRLLIADADADSRLLYRECLRPIGDIIEAADGRDALVIALAHPPSLVITETRLPVFDGYALLDVLRHDAMTRGVPILVVTAYAPEPELKRARDAGADSVLIKPVTRDALLREVQRLLRQTRELQESSRQTAARPTRAATVATATPPVSPPTTLVCPGCDSPLKYQGSHVGGVRTSAEQWDTFVCPACGPWEYRPRTKKLRRVT